MTDLFLHIYRFLKHRFVLRWFLLVGSLVVFVWFASKLKMEEDITGFIPKDPQSERVNFIFKNLAVSDKIILRFGAGDTTGRVDKDLLVSAAERFSVVFDSIAGGKKLVHSVLYKIDSQKFMEISGFVVNNIPFFLEDTDYPRIDSLLTSGKIKTLLESNKKLLVSPAGMVLKANLIADPLHLSGHVIGKLKDFQVNRQYEIYNDYIFSKKKTDLLCFITAAYPVTATDKNAELVRCLDQAVANVRQGFKNNLKITYFGAVPVAVTNATQIKRDTLISIIISVVLILLLLGWFFRSGKALLLITFPVVFGTVMSLAALFFIKGSISAVAIGAGSVILGIAVNYSMHFMVHLKHEPDSEKTLKEIASPMTIGSITTIGAFLSLLFISADAMRDFGLFASFTLLGTLLFVLIFLPHFSKLPRKHDRPVFERISDFRLGKTKLIMLVLVVLTLVFFFFSGNVTFDSDMNKINYMKPEQRKAFNELSSVSTVGQKGVYLVSGGKNMEQALRAYEKSSGEIERLKQNGKILSVSGIGSLLPSDSLQRVKIERWNNFWKSRKNTLKQLLLGQGPELGFKTESFNDFFALLDKKFIPENINFFDPLTGNLTKEYLINKENQAAVVTLLYTAPENTEYLSRQLTHGPSFVFDQAGISKKLINVLSNDFNKVLYICGLLVIVFLAFSFGRIELSIISFLPMLLSWIWILGIMAIFGINFNIVNIVLATFIFGLGDDYTIFMMDGMMNEYAYHRKLLSSYKTAVGLSAITMFVGIGTLVFARHPALRSLGSITVVGMFSVVIMSYIVPPVLFNYLIVKNKKYRLIPITLKQQLATVYSFAFFIFGSLYLTLKGFLLLTVMGKTDRNKLLYHRSICTIFRFIVKYVPLVKTKVINESGENFNKPAIIICNHQSHLDLMYILMLSPKIIVLTNEWVWKSPFYGQIIRYADFYPVANGIENSVDKLAALVAKGYSIVVFPEGTRSADCSILRFHRGAFYLAEQLGLDLLPVLIHGVGHVFPKEEFLLRKGEVTVKVLERITPENKQFGSNYPERAKQLRKFYMAGYDRLRRESETPDYYSNLVFHNYIYKGAEIEKQTRRELSKYKNYTSLISLLPDSGRLLHVNCNTGVFDLLCSLVKKNLQITAIDPDEENILLAENCASKPANVSYFQNTADNIDLSEFDYVLEFNPENDDISKKCRLNKKVFYILADQSNTYVNENLCKTDQIEELAGFKVITCKR